MFYVLGYNERVQLIVRAEIFVETSLKKNPSVTSKLNTNIEKTTGWTQNL